MGKGSGEVSVLANKVRDRREQLDALDASEIDRLAESWGTSFAMFGLDQDDPVVGGTVLVTAKMLTHRIASLVEFGHPEEDLEQSLYVTAEASLVGLTLLEKAKAKKPPLYGLVALLAALALTLSAAQGAAALWRHDKVAVSGYVTTEEGTTAWVTLRGTPDEAIEAVRRYQAGEATSVPIDVHLVESGHGNGHE